MNDRGWSVGASRPPSGEFLRAVLWRGTSAIDLGIGGTVLPDGSAVSSIASDVNEDGVVAVNSHRNNKNGRLISSSTWLWKSGNAVRLPSGKLGSHTNIEALNDFGTAVGWIDPPTRDVKVRAVIWRHGQSISLPMPRGAQSMAIDINNHGLVIGSVNARPWYWRVSGGSGPLPVLKHANRLRVITVDDRDRILGRALENLLWKGPHAKPQRLPSHPRGASAMNNYGDLAGTHSAGRGDGYQAWVSTLQADRQIRLPAPADGHEWLNTYGRSVIRGVTRLAPKGGVTVGGWGKALNPTTFEEFSYPIVWTCAPLS